MVKRVASVNNNTIVVVNAVGPIIMEAWVENPNGAHLTVSFSGHALIPSPPHIVTAVVSALGRSSRPVVPIAFGQVWAGLPGQEAGNSLVDILYGDVNPR